MKVNCFSFFRPSLGEEPESRSRLKDARASVKLLQLEDENAALQEEVKRVRIQV
jgi:hypothetical protein